VIDPMETARRHHRERPLEKLTDEELYAIRRLSEAGIFSANLTAALDTLGDLALREDIDHRQR